MIYVFLGCSGFSDVIFVFFFLEFYILFWVVRVDYIESEFDRSFYGIDDYKSVGGEYIIVVYSD